MRPIGGVQTVEFPRDEYFQPRAFGEVVRLFGKFRRRLRQPLGRHELFKRPSAFRERGNRVVRCRRELIPNRTVQFASRLRLSHATPLFEKERHIRGETLIANAPNPLGFDRTSTVTALTPDDDPTDAG